MIVSFDHMVVSGSSTNEGIEVRASQEQLGELTKGLTRVEVTLWYIIFKGFFIQNSLTGFIFFYGSNL